MTTIQFIKDLRERLRTTDNKVENLAFVANELSSFYEMIEKSELRSTFPKEIYQELNDLPNTLGYTEHTRNLRLSKLERKLFEILDSIEQYYNIDLQNKMNNSEIKINSKIELTDSQKGEFEAKFKLGEIETSLKGKGKYGIIIAGAATLIILSFLYLFNMNKPTLPVKENCAESIKTLKDNFTFLLRNYTKTLDSLSQVLSKENTKINGTTNYLSKEQTQEEKRNVVGKIDYINAVILPDLGIMSNNCNDSLAIIKIHKYENEIKNF